jgi:hypothetical protein
MRGEGYYRRGGVSTAGGTVKVIERNADAQNQLIEDILNEVRLTHELIACTPDTSPPKS